MSNAGGVTEAHIVGWVVTGVFLAVNLGWNLINQRKTNALGAQIRHDQYTFDIWARIRNRIEDRLSSFVDQALSAPGHMQTLPNNIDIKSVFPALVLDLHEKHDALARVMIEADQSRYCNGYNWEIASRGSQKENESSFDLLSAELEAASRSDSRDELLGHLKAMRTYALEIERAVRSKIEEQDANLHPDSAVS